MRSHAKQGALPICEAAAPEALQGSAKAVNSSLTLHSSSGGPQRSQQQPREQHVQASVFLGAVNQVNGHAAPALAPMHQGASGPQSSESYSSGNAAPSPYQAHQHSPHAPPSGPKPPPPQHPSQHHHPTAPATKSSPQLPLDSLLLAAADLTLDYTPTLPRPRPARSISMRSTSSHSLPAPAPPSDSKGFAGDRSMEGSGKLRASRSGRGTDRASGGSRGGWLSTNDAMPPISVLLEAPPVIVHTGGTAPPSPPSSLLRLQGSHTGQPRTHRRVTGDGVTAPQLGGRNWGPPPQPLIPRSSSSRLPDSLPVPLGVAPEMPPDLEQMLEELQDEDAARLAAARAGLHLDTELLEEGLPAGGPSGSSHMPGPRSAGPSESGGTRFWWDSQVAHADHHHVLSTTGAPAAPAGLHHVSTATATAAPPSPVSLCTPPGLHKQTAAQECQGPPSAVAGSGTGVVKGGTPLGEAVPPTASVTLIPIASPASPFRSSAPAGLGPGLARRAQLHNGGTAYSLALHSSTGRGGAFSRLSDVMEDGSQTGQGSGANSSSRELFGVGNGYTGMPEGVGYRRVYTEPPGSPRAWPDQLASSGAADAGAVSSKAAGWPADARAAEGGGVAEAGQQQGSNSQQQGRGEVMNTNQQHMSQQQGHSAVQGHTPAPAAHFILHPPSPSPSSTPKHTAMAQRRARPQSAMLPQASTSTTQPSHASLAASQHSSSGQKSSWGLPFGTASISSTVAAHAKILGPAQKAVPAHRHSYGGERNLPSSGLTCQADLVCLGSMRGDTEAGAVHGGAVHDDLGRDSNMYGPVQQYLEGGSRTSSHVRPTTPASSRSPSGAQQYIPLTLGGTSGTGGTGGTSKRHYKPEVQAVTASRKVVPVPPLTLPARHHTPHTSLSGASPTQGVTGTQGVTSRGVTSSASVTSSGLPSARQLARTWLSVRDAMPELSLLSLPESRQGPGSSGTDHSTTGAPGNTNPLGLRYRSSGSQVALAGCVELPTYDVTDLPPQHTLLDSDAASIHLQAPNSSSSTGTTLLSPKRRGGAAGSAGGHSSTQVLGHTTTTHSARSSLSATRAAAGGSESSKARGGTVSNTSIANQYHGREPGNRAGLDHHQHAASESDPECDQDEPEPHARVTDSGSHTPSSRVLSPRPSLAAKRPPPSSPGTPGVPPPRSTPGTRLPPMFVNPTYAFEGAAGGAAGGGGGLPVGGSNSGVHQQRHPPTVTSLPTSAGLQPRSGPRPFLAPVPVAPGSPFMGKSASMSAALSAARAHAIWAADAAGGGGTQGPDHNGLQQQQRRRHQSGSQQPTLPEQEGKGDWHQDRSHYSHDGRGRLQSPTVQQYPTSTPGTSRAVPAVQEEVEDDTFGGTAWVSGRASHNVLMRARGSRGTGVKTSPAVPVASLATGDTQSSNQQLQGGGNAFVKRSSSWSRSISLTRSSGAASLMREIGASLFSFFRSFGARAGLGSGPNSTGFSSAVVHEKWVGRDSGTASAGQGQEKGEAGGARVDVASLAGSVPRHLSMKEVQLLRRSKAKRASETNGPGGGSNQQSSSEGPSSANTTPPSTSRQHGGTSSTRAGVPGAVQLHPHHQVLPPQPIKVQPRPSTTSNTTPAAQTVSQALCSQTQDASGHDHSTPHTGPLTHLSSTATGTATVTASSTGGTPLSISSSGVTLPSPAHTFSHPMQPSTKGQQQQQPSLANQAAGAASLQGNSSGTPFEMGNDGGQGVAGLLAAGIYSVAPPHDGSRDHLQAPSVSPSPGPPPVAGLTAAGPQPLATRPSRSTVASVPTAAAAAAAAASRALHAAAAAPLSDLSPHLSAPASSRVEAERAGGGTAVPAPSMQDGPLPHERARSSGRLRSSSSGVTGTTREGQRGWDLSGIARGPGGVGALGGGSGGSNWDIPRLSDPGSERGSGGGGGVTSGVTPHRGGATGGAGRTADRVLGVLGSTRLPLPMPSFSQPSAVHVLPRGLLGGAGGSGGLGRNSGSGGVLHDIVESERKSGGQRHSGSGTYPSESRGAGVLLNQLARREGGFSAGPVHHGAIGTTPGVASSTGAVLRAAALRDAKGQEEEDGHSSSDEGQEEAGAVAGTRQAGLLRYPPNQPSSPPRHTGYAADSTFAVISQPLRHSQQQRLAQSPSAHNAPASAGGIAAQSGGTTAQSNNTSSPVLPPPISVLRAASSSLDPFPFSPRALPGSPTSPSGPNTKCSAPSAAGRAAAAGRGSGTAAAVSLIFPGLETDDFMTSPGGNRQQVNSSGNWTGCDQQQAAPGGNRQQDKIVTGAGPLGKRQQAAHASGSSNWFDLEQEDKIVTGGLSRPGGKRQGAPQNSSGTNWRSSDDQQQQDHEHGCDPPSLSLFLPGAAHSPP